LRSLFKIVFSDFFASSLSEKPLVTHRTFFSRHSIITPFFLGMRIRVYTGMRIFSFLVRPVHIGHKFGEFAITKLLGPSVHTHKKEGKKGAKKKGKK